jgi:hypothetical protein
MKDLAQHLKMLIDSDQSLAHHWLNFAAECKANNDNLKLRRRLKEYLNECIDRHVVGDKEYLIRDTLGEVFNDPVLLNSLTSMLWEDEGVDEILNE